jgi:hypothetical protein
MWLNEHVFPIPKLKPILNHPHWKTLEYHYITHSHVYTMYINFHMCPPWNATTHGAHLIFRDYHNPNLGLITKAKAWKGAGQKCKPRVTFAFLGMWECGKEWIHTLLSGLPFWELESLWNPEFSRKDFSSQNSSFKKVS